MKLSFETSYGPDLTEFPLKECHICKSDFVYYVNSNSLLCIFCDIEFVFNQKGYLGLIYVSKSGRPVIQRSNARIVIQTEYNGPQGYIFLCKNDEFSTEQIDKAKKLLLLK